ncbi:hypothetical protein N24_0438 [Corynebacterium suranareeae]|uniref:Uncharacterized protein n=1 Tax=Corynebacterium suranareeae TaxID=2506452 RepID=A0A160PQZ8_9CORY|nr:hypothetical protein [Corynebacterium suranareeae]BAU94700.1 hypothetical protein N24_0438 [Corynebacterium suranareeae]
MIFLPIPIVVEDLDFIGSAAVDGLISLAVLLYDALSGTGITDVLSSVSAEG